MTAPEPKRISSAEADERAGSADGKAQESPSDGDGSNRIGHLLWELSSRVTLIREGSMDGSELRAQSIGNLEKILANAGITVSEVARWSMKSQQAVSENVGRLERLGYVERRLGKGRGIELYITSAGEQALKRGNEFEGELEHEFERLLGPDLYERLRTSLQEARAVFDTHSRPRPAPQAA
jgi:DNA-binding MarR family transcriptional regulator